MAELTYQPIEQVKVSTMIVDQIKNHILEGNLQPGDALPSERDLMKAFKVSRSSLREALKILDATGFVTVAQRKRTRVKSIVADSVTDPLRPLLKKDKATVLEIHDVRRCLESWNARYAAERAMDVDLQAMEKCIQAMEEKVAQDLSLTQEDSAFHMAVSAASHNKIQTHLMYSIYSLIQDTVGICYESDDKRQIIREHKEIFLAIKAGDPDKAQEKMIYHLDRIRERIHAYFAKKKEQK
ncbi:MAG: FadR family transcriptional regulator [Desulfobacterales bacterium]|nr:FadR family transcriptional regulator [Desulfobacterales bacterium]